MNRARFQRAHGVVEGLAGDGLHQSAGDGDAVVRAGHRLACWIHAYDALAIFNALQHSAISPVGNCRVDSF